MMNVLTLPIFNTVLPLVLIWELIWKGIALWKSARQEQKIWFVAILLLNTLGLLPIIYLLFWQKKGPIIGMKKVAPKKAKRKRKR
jgi:hypothetical protein